MIGLESIFYFKMPFFLKVLYDTLIHICIATLGIIIALLIIGLLIETIHLLLTEMGFIKEKYD